MKEVAISFFKTDYGELIIGSFEGKICLCDWKYRQKRVSIDQRIQQALQAVFVEKETLLHVQLKEQLIQYFDGSREGFEIPLLLIGTPFQKKIWTLLLEIPYGSTSSYIELAKRYQDAQAVRAVANANGANAISILIPCHRVVGINGTLVGYAGGLSAKQKLLDLESKNRDKQLELFK